MLAHLHGHFKECPDVATVVHHGRPVNQRGRMSQVGEVDEGAPYQPKPWEAVEEGIAARRGPRLGRALGQRLMLISLLAAAAGRRG